MEIQDYFKTLRAIQFVFNSDTVRHSMFLSRDLVRNCAINLFPYGMSLVAFFGHDTVKCSSGERIR